LAHSLQQPQGEANMRAMLADIPPLPEQAAEIRTVNASRMAAAE
jgi:hypothetical protein